MTMPKMLLDLHQASMHGTTAIWNKYIPIVSLMRAKTNVFPGTLFNKVVNIYLFIFLQQLATQRLDKLYFLLQNNVFCNSISHYYENTLQESIGFTECGCFKI